MKNYIVLMLMIASVGTGCLHDPYAAPKGYVINDPYCWHENKDGKWEVVGLTHMCPPNTRSYVQKVKPVKPTLD